MTKMSSRNKALIFPVFNIVLAVGGIAVFLSARISVGLLIPLVMAGSAVLGGVLPLLSVALLKTDTSRQLGYQAAVNIASLAAGASFFFFPAAVLVLCPLFLIGAIVLYITETKTFTEWLTLFLTDPIGYMLLIWLAAVFSVRN